MKISKMLPLLIAPMLLTSCGSGGGHANVGLLYCSAEANSLYQVEEIKKELEAKGLSTKMISFSDSNDLSSVLSGSIKSVDTLFIPTDNTCAKNGEIIDPIVRANKVPVFAGEEGLLKKCGAITLSINYYSLGVITGQMAIDVLMGSKNISNMPIQYDTNLTKKYNKSFCDEVGVTVPSGYVEMNEAEPKKTIDIQNVNPNNTKFTIGISQFVAHEALDAATEGFKDAVKAGLGENNVTFDYQNAAEQMDLCTTIANNFVAHKVDLIMANATPSLKAAAQSTTTIPVLGTSVTDYGSALNIANFDGTVGGNVSGTSDLVSLKQQADILSEVFKSFMK